MGVAVPLKTTPPRLGLQLGRELGAKLRFQTLRVSKTVLEVFVSSGHAKLSGDVVAD